MQIYEHRWIGIYSSHMLLNYFLKEFAVHKSLNMCLNKLNCYHLLFNSETNKLVYILVTNNFANHQVISNKVLFNVLLGI